MDANPTPEQIEAAKATIRKIIRSWRRMSNEQFVESIRNARDTAPELWDWTDFRFHVDIELRCRDLLKKEQRLVTPIDFRG